MQPSLTIFTPALVGLINMKKNKSNSLTHLKKES